MTDLGNFPQSSRAHFLAMGFRLVEPGTPHGVKLGLRSKDWLPDSFIARKENLVILPLLTARKPGTGSFSRLLAHLDARLIEVAVSHPTGRFRDYLERKGWRPVGADLWMRP